MQSHPDYPQKPVADSSEVETNPYVIKTQQNLDNARELNEQKDLNKGGPEFKQDDGFEFLEAEMAAQEQTIGKVVDGTDS